MRRFNRGKDKIKLGVAILAVILFVVLIFQYSAAYENSAEWTTVTISDKETQTHSDDDGGSYTTYVVRTHFGEEFNCKGRGWGGARGLYNSFRVDHQYEILVAGLGYFNRDILENKREVIDLRPEASAGR